MKHRMVSGLSTLTVGKSPKLDSRACGRCNVFIEYVVRHLDVTQLLLLSSFGLDVVDSIDRLGAQKPQQAPWIDGIYTVTSPPARGEAHEPAMERGEAIEPA